MKAKYTLIALLAITLFGCDDNTAGLGLGMFPGSDQDINGRLSTFDVTTESVKAGKIYAKTNIGYVGKFTDETFGTYQAGFLAELNCPQGMTFPEVYKEVKDESGKVIKATGSMVTEVGDDKDITLIHDKNGQVIGNVRAVELYLWYTSYFGDSLTACRMSIYELDNKLNTKQAYYTDIDPKDFYDSSKAPLGTKAYTAVDLSVKDSIRYSSTYVPSVHVTVGNSIGERIITTARKYGDNFYKYFQEGIANSDDTYDKTEGFKGIYVKSDYGDGTVLYIDQSQMNVAYKCYATDTITGIKLQTHDGKDSTYYAYRTFASTREVIQANQLQNDKEKIDALIEQGENTYLKTPAGIFTQATLPVEDIKNDLDGDTLNAVKLTFTNYNQTSDKKFGMSIPSNVMIIRKKLKDSFFEKNQLNDGISSYLTTHSSNSNQYTFANITKLINACIEDEKAAQEAFDAGKTVQVETGRNEDGSPIITTFNTFQDWKENSGWDQIVLMPVLVTYDSSGNSYYGTSNVISIQHDLKPGYVRLKGGKNGSTDNTYKLKLEVVSTNFGPLAKAK